MIQRSHIVIALSLLAGFVFHAAPAAADDRGLSGVVAAQAVVADTNGKPVWAEIKPDGTSTDICPDLGNFSLLSGEAYRAAVAAYDAVKRQVPEAQRRVLTAADYAAASFQNAAGQAVLPKPTLSATTFSVVVRTQAAMRVPSDALILLQSPIDLRTPDPIGTDVLGLLMGPCSSCTCGENIASAKRIVYQAKLGKIAYKTAYFIDADTHVAQPNLFGFLRHIDQLLGPVAGVKVDLWTGTRTTPGVTSPEGIYTAYFYDPPFPNCGPIDTPVTATVQFDAFNPRTNQPALFSTTLPAPFLTAVDCTAPAGPEINFHGFQQSVNFGLQVALLAGTAVVKNEARGAIAMPSPTDVTIGGSTSYDARRATFTPVTPPADMDLDGDGVADETVLEDGAVKVWLGNHHSGQDPPDLVRLADRKEDLTDRGLLSQISADDLKLTDIYVYRLSTMQRVGARRSANASLPAATWTTNPPPPDTGVSGGKLAFDMLLQGPRGFYAAGNGHYSDWAAKTMMDRALIEQPQGHLVVGEPVKIYLINRATGYMGSATATVVGNTLPNGGASRLTFRPDQEVIMRPPNLRVKAERTFTPHAQETRANVLVGSEGAAMTDDDYVKVTTEWLDWDGSALPNDLPGFTGRLAHVIAANQLGPAAGDLAEFDIPAGVKTQQITLPEQVSHFYIHVHPFWKQDNPDFSASAESQGRPARYVPILVPIYNETETATATKLARAAGEADPEPIYSWVYRPEMQFSLFDLELNKMIETRENGQTVTVALDSENPKPLPIDDTKVDFIYTLLEDQLPVLPQFGPGRELVLAFGDAEVRATVSQNGTVTFDDPGRLAALDTADLTTLRLYQNGDDANVLWEYGFLTVSLTPGPSDKMIEVSADERDVKLLALVLDGTSTRPHRVQWRATGAGTMIEPAGGSAASPNDVFPGLVRVSTQAGAESQVEFKIDDGTGTDTMVLVAKSATLKTVPGAAAQIAPVSQSGKVAVGGLGEIEVAVQVTDAYGNDVADGTPVSFSADNLKAETDGVTVGGRVSAKLHSMGVPGDTVLTVASGTVAWTTTVTVHDVHFAWNVPATVQVNQTAPVGLAITSSYGDLSGLNVTLGALRGTLDSQKFVLSSTGTIATTFKAIDFAGKAQVLARVGSTADYFDFDVTDTPVHFDNPMLIGDEVADGTFTVSMFDGTTRDIGYVAATTLRVPGTPGASVEVELGSLAEPALQPVMSYPMVQILADQVVVDVEQGIDGQAANIVTVGDHPAGVPGSYDFSASSKISVPVDADLDKASGLGFSAWIKSDRTSVPVLAFTQRSMTLAIDASRRLVLSAQTTAGPITVMSAPLNGNGWHQIGAAFKDGQLELEVDGNVSPPAPAPADLVKTGSATAIVIGDGFVGHMADFRVYDWGAQPLVRLSTSSTTGTFTIPASGTAEIAVHSTGSFNTSAERLLRRKNRYAAREKHGLVRTAHAELPPFCFNPPPSGDDPIEHAAWMLEFTRDCYTRDHIEKIKVTTKIAGFTVINPLALQELQLYTALHIGAHAARTFLPLAHCVEGVFGTGNNVVAYGCDFVSSLIPGFGDDRDIALQNYYYYFDIKDKHGKAKFDYPTYIFASLGEVVDLLGVLAAAGGAVAGGQEEPAVVIEGFNGVMAGLKIAAKRARAIATQLAKDPKLILQLAHYLDDSVIKIKQAGLKEWANALLRVMPLMQLSIFVFLTGDEFLELAGMMMEMADDPDEFLAVADYIYDLLAKVELRPADFGIQGSNAPWGLREAFAGVPIYGLTTVKAALRWLEDMRKYGVKERLPSIANQLKAAIKALRKTKAPLVKGMDAHSAESVHAFLKATYLDYLIDPKSTDAISSLLLFKGMKGILSDEEMVKKLMGAIAKLPLDKLERGDPEVLAQVKKGLAQVFADLSKSENFSQGAAHQLIMIAHYIEKAGPNATDVLLAVEKERRIFAAGVEIGRRFDDAVMKIEGREVICESKGRDPNRVKALIESGLRRAKKKATATAAEVAKKEVDESGQLFNDIVDMVASNDYGKIIWNFDARSAGKEKEYLKLIRDGLDDPAVAKELRDVLQMSKKQWDDWLLNFDDNFANFIRIIP